MSSETTLKGAAIAILVGGVVAIVGATQKPWWWCNTFGCAAEASPGTGALPPPTDGGAGNSGGAKPPTDEPPQPPPDEPAVKFVPAHMGPLLMATNFQGMDINNGESVQNVQACVKLCADTGECQAMTYVYPTETDTQNGTCWLKGSVPAGQHNEYMISARKIAAVGAP